MNSAEEDSLDDSDLSLPSTIAGTTHAQETEVMNSDSEQVLVVQPVAKSSMDYFVQGISQNSSSNRHHGEITSVHSRFNGQLKNGDVSHQERAMNGYSSVQTSRTTGQSSMTLSDTIDDQFAVEMMHKAVKLRANHVTDDTYSRDVDYNGRIELENGLNGDACKDVPVECSPSPPSIVVTDDSDPTLQDQYCGSDVEISRSSESIQEFESLERKYHCELSSSADYDCKDFVVHRNTFSDELLSEDAYSSLNEDNDNYEDLDSASSRHRHRQEPEIPSPDYGSSEEDEGEYQIYHTGVPDSRAAAVSDGSSAGRFADDQNGVDEDDFVDNSASYRSDPRRYVYYPEEKELDTIPEEDEDIDDVTEYGVAYMTNRDEEETDDQEHEGHREDDSFSKAISQTDGDSGVTDDQRSSAAESTEDDDDFDKRSGSAADTDSAQGSMVPDCTSDLSPTFPDKIEDLATKTRNLFGLEASLGDRKVNGWDAEDPSDETRECVDAIEESFKQVLDVQDADNEESEEQEKEDLLDAVVETPSNGVEIPVITISEEEKPVVNHAASQESLQSSAIPNGDVWETKSVKSVTDDSQLDSDGSIDIAGGDYSRRPRSSTLNWDPTQLLKDMYKMEYLTLNGSTDDGCYDIEGYLEKMPSGRKKATYWNPWKRRFFRVKDGSLYCYESSQSEKPLMTLQLVGGIVDTMENNMIGVDDRKGHYVAMKCSSEEEAEMWKTALLHHCCENSSVTYIQPVQYPLQSHKKVIIIDLGSCSMRAGILMDSPTLPQLFFPTVCATNKFTGQQIFGFEALLPDVRKNSTISFPVLPSAKITKYTMNVDALPGLLEKIFHDLNVDPTSFQVQLCVPRSFSLQTQIAVVKTLLESFGVKSVNLTHQAILTLYAYNATSGIVVDIGDRLDILPINEGYIVENGVTRLPYGGQRLCHHLRHALAQKHISLTSDVESYLVRHIIEQSCYVARNYNEELARFTNDPDSMEKNISIEQYFQGNPPWEAIPLDFGRFQAPEGLFSPDLWGLDSPGLHRLVHRAIQECSMDIRREMARSIYVSGGVTLLPGLVERLEAEVDKLTPPSVNPKVHASPYRYHMSYLGACRLASSDGFDQVSVTKEEWTRRGNLCLQKWHL